MNEREINLNIRQEQESEKLKNYNIWYIDDDESNLKAMQKLAKAYKLNLIGFQKASEAVQDLKEFLKEKIEVEETFRDMNNTEEIVKGSGGVFSQNIINYKKEEDGKKEIINDLGFNFDLKVEKLVKNIAIIIRGTKILAVL